ncbi:hypothetical protein LWC34_04580 [Kibdelosporangium philippinense]|uniref:Uncharacterized protein n=1 Tax=Kibdelosporangium philippinense TaxID=211113 RepID=A0ABS8Z2E1_9PSEU|nr:hypothetical protein [Kibdelosporangium philippinense]MCE7002104.1 hypothetical protein [Kibdelosporangium philippinense]
MNLILSLQGLEVETSDDMPDLGAGARTCCGGDTDGTGQHGPSAYRSLGPDHTPPQTESDDYSYSSETV